MHKKFDHQAIEKKWQEKWETTHLYECGSRDAKKEKKYILVEWPYPSGNLHVGHWYAFAVVDIYVRMLRMQGKQVLFPIGFDAFGLPAENAAVKRNTDPKTWTDANIAHMTSQLKSMGNAFSWDKKTSSTDPEYYKWTQWMFTQFFEKGIAYKGTGMVNWCPGCKTVVANEQVLSDNSCERSGDQIERKEMPQWLMRITEYADRLIDDLDALDWPEYIKEAQRQWIGRSQGSHITFKLSSGDSITVFTTRADTLFGATYLVLAPEHELIEKLKDQIETWSEVEMYRKEASLKDEITRTNGNREKTGVLLQGVTAINPATKEIIPVYIADYVLKGYGTGAIMAVPAHDERDFKFAQKFNLPIRQVVVPCANDSKNPPRDGLEEIKRDTVVVHLKDKSTGKYALLNWHGTLEGITTAVMGGIEADQTPEEAALTEIFEETAIKNAVIIKKSSWITGSKYCASHKNQNRCAHTTALLAEVENLNEQGEIVASEQSLHTLVWVSEAEVLNRLTPEHQKIIWKLLHDDIQILANPGYLINSGEFDGADSEASKKSFTDTFGGTHINTYRLRDWSIGRQRYWGVPIPIVYAPDGKPHVVPKEYLPWLLPTDVDYMPTGIPPLAKSNELKERTERIFGKGWTPEVETMDTFVDSSWYFLRYLDVKNDVELSSKKSQEDWMPIDTYFGGSEHTTMHLLYSRFWQKALFDLKLVTTAEPYTMRINRGLVLGPDGNKMSKSKGNVIDPDEYVQKLGADTVKMYLAFMGPYGEPTNYPWDIGGIAGLRRFLERVNGLSAYFVETETVESLKSLHKTIKKVAGDITAYKFNTAISSLMIFLNEVEKTGITRTSYAIFLRLLAPFAPHITEELWEGLGNSNSIHSEAFPKAEENLLIEEAIMISVQINGKMRGRIKVQTGASEAQVLEEIKKDQKILGKNTAEITRIFYVPGKIINLII